jgi:Ca2+-binding RTX toxin-like protein
MELNTQLTSVARIGGGAGDDALVAVSGTVYASGGTGRDSFALFSDTRNVQLLIQDFNATTDVIDLSALVRNASGSLTTEQVAARKAEILSHVLQSLEGQTHSQAVELNVSNWLESASGATVAKISIEFENGTGASTALTSHNFVFDVPSWRDLDALVNPTP